MPNALLLPEILRLVIENVEGIPDLLSCACVNKAWNEEALRRLYHGSLNNLHFRTPDMGSLNCLLVASRERFVRNMSFVKHLLIAPEIAGRTTPPFTQEPQLVSLDYCRALSRDEDSERLLRPNGKGPSSIVIPYSVVPYFGASADWSDRAPELLVSPNVQYLGLDIGYFEWLYLELEPDMYSHLRALTIYKQRREDEGDIQRVCSMLAHCNLEFFHLEEDVNETAPIDAELVVEELIRFRQDTSCLLTALRSHHNLRALALMYKNYFPPSSSAPDVLPSEKEQCPWPNLQALYAGQGYDTQYWTQHFNLFESLQILRLRIVIDGDSGEFGIPFQAITKFRGLRALQLEFYVPTGAEGLLDIVKHCTLLRRLSVNELKDLSASVISDLLPYLPRIERLELDSKKFRADGKLLEELAAHCPRLTFVDLKNARLWLPLAQLKNVKPLERLEWMRFGSIYFENPRNLMKPDVMPVLLSEWRRVFPRLRGPACEADEPYWVEHMLSEGWSGFMKKYQPMSFINLTDNTTSSEPDLSFDETSGSPWRRFRELLWGALGFKVPPRRFYPPMKHMWQSDLEIETIGWPVVPLLAFQFQSMFGQSRAWAS
ncbi:hypothetical protein BJY01DRAFT_89753 [Aspergillus pseudoustus]|uniref:F-box domain-containing protein n=1 Tax=Aspergillus pseudoustus TaxID=1810923 RepID=A0ABR4J1R1_9EURO